MELANKENLEQRVTDLEKLVQKIIALPHLSNLAGRDTKALIDRLQESIALKKARLQDQSLSQEERDTPHA